MLIVVSCPQTLVLSLVYLSRLKCQISFVRWNTSKVRKLFLINQNLFSFFESFFCLLFILPNPPICFSGRLGSCWWWLL